MSKIGIAIKHIVSNALGLFVLGETGSIEDKRGAKEKFTRSQERRFRISRHLVTRTNLWLLRVSRGHLGNSFLGRPVLLLTTVGRKSGKPRTQPVFFLRDGQRFVLVASNGGSSDDPLWLLNAQANPAVLVVVGGVSQNMICRIASADEKAQLWPRLTTHFPYWQEVEDRCQRTFPVVLLEPATS